MRPARGWWVREALLCGPSATPSSPDAVLTARRFLRREPCGPRRHSGARAREKGEHVHAGAGLEGSTAAALSTTARHGRPPTSKQAHAAATDGPDPDAGGARGALCTATRAARGERSAGAATARRAEQENGLGSASSSRDAPPSLGPQGPRRPTWACAALASAVQAPPAPPRAPGCLCSSGPLGVSGADADRLPSKHWAPQGRGPQN